MAAVGSLLFCTACGNLLPASTGQKDVLVPCDVCGTQNKDASWKVIVSKSKPSAFPSALRAKRSAVQTLTEEDVQRDAVIQKTCPECGRTEMRFYTQQLRSADEGSTVFYHCECGYRETQNN